MKLEVGESKLVTVLASEKWHADPSIEITDGDVYSFEVKGNQLWKDWMVNCGADGWSKWYIGKKKNRLSGANFFLLCASLNRNEQRAFAVGKRLDRWIAPENGTLEFFANDRENRYGNNSGSLKVTVTRTS